MKKLMEMSVKEEPAREVTLLKPEYLSAVGAKADEMHPQQGRVLTPVSEEVALSPGAKDELDEKVQQQQPKNGLQPLQQQQQQQQQRAFKRRNSLNVGFKHPGFKRRRRANSDCDPVLPSNFLLGGNIFDPLNLNSLLDEEVNKALNAETPKSSPLPCRNRDPVEILVPKDITDPLSLNAGSEVLPSPLKLGRKRRHRHSHHPPSQLPQSATAGGGSAAELAEKSRIPTLNAQDCATDHQQQQPPPEAPPAEQEGPQPYELNTAINCRDEIVSPVLRGGSEPSSGGGGGTRHRKRRRTSSKSEPGKAPAGTEEEPKEGKKPTPEKTRGKASHHHHQHHPHQHNYHRESKAQPNFQSKHKRFQYGNYSKYYGYRNPGRCEDPRLAVLQPAWFRGKDILDLGCNAGHLTLSIAKDLRPARIVGVDIDGTLVHSARQNIRHFLSEDVLPSPGSGAAGQVQRQFPLSLSRCRGPIAAPPVTLDRCVLEFPNNVTFIQGNYVLEKDELLDTQRPEYDVILCLSLTKWIHLNWGDEGLKRMFKRIYRHLRPGGIFILEPQPWSSYGKRRKLTETIYKNYYKIIFKPEQFTSYLLSPEVGFSSYELVGTPQSTSKGFQRPVYLFHKSRPSSAN